ncbi:MAG: hypothetical protein ACLFSQ_05545 [Candidatus Zixiibacteriota bacterium]
MAETIEELTIQYEEDDLILTKELDKEVLTKGLWTTIIFRYKLWSRKDEQYGPDKYTIRRYQKQGGYYRPKSKFNISSVKQAKQIIDVLSDWVEEAEKQ